MLILQARNWNRPHSITALQQISKRPSKTWVQCHARIFLNCSVLSQHLSGGSMTTITIISRNWANCIPRLSFAKKKWKSRFWYFHRPLPVGSGTFAQIRTYWSASLWNTRWAQAWWVTTAPGNTLKKSVKIQKQTKTKDTKHILSNQLLVEYHNSTTESFRHRFKELQFCRITLSGLLKCYPPKLSQEETLFTRCKLKWQNKGFQSLAEVINLNLEL